MTEERPVGVPLAATIQMLRAELGVAVAAGEGEDLQFALGPVELEFELGITTEGSGEAGIRFWVVTLGADGSRSWERTHRIKLTLTPHRLGDPEGEVTVAGRGELGD